MLEPHTCDRLCPRRDGNLSTALVAYHNPKGLCGGLGGEASSKVVRTQVFQEACAEPQAMLACRPDQAAAPGCSEIIPLSYFGLLSTTALETWPEVGPTSSNVGRLWPSM